MSPSLREAGGDHPWGEGSGSPLFFRTSTLSTVCWREGGRERNTTHHLTHTHTHTHSLTNCTHQEPAIPPQPYIPDGPFSCFNQTPSRSSLSSPQLPPYLLDFQPFALCPPHIWNLLLRSPTPPDSKSTNKFLQTHLLICTEQICPSLIPQPTSFFLSCCSLCLLSSPSLSAFSLISSLLILAPKNASLSLVNLVIFTDSATTCSVKTTQAPCSSQVSSSNTKLLLPMTYKTPPPSTSR